MARTRTATAEPIAELPEIVTLYPDAHHYIEGVPQDILTLPRDRAAELLAYGRRNAHGKAAWDGVPFAPAFHLEQQNAVWEHQIGEHTPFATPPATGGVFDPAGPLNMIVGEAGPETIAVLRNPRAVPAPTEDGDQPTSPDGLNDPQEV